MLSKTFVGSSNLAHAKYDQDTQQLIIGFTNGGEYSYDGVPMDIWQGLTQASSAGSYFHANIKNGGFPYNRLA